MDRLSKDQWLLCHLWSLKTGEPHPFSNEKEFIAKEEKRAVSKQKILENMHRRTRNRIRAQKASEKASEAKKTVTKTTDGDSVTIKHSD